MKEKNKAKKNISKKIRYFDSLSLSSDDDDFSSHSKKQYSSKTLSFFSKSYSSNDDYSETSSKDKKKMNHSVKYHYHYKNRCEDFSADTATSDFDDLFSNSSYSSSTIDLSDDDL